MFMIHFDTLCKYAQGNVQVLDESAFSSTIKKEGKKFFSYEIRGQHAGIEFILCDLKKATVGGTD